MDMKKLFKPEESAKVVQSPEPKPALKGTVKFIGVQKGKDKVGTVCYTNIIVTLKDGVLQSVESQDAAYNIDEAINDATGWIDNHYLEVM